MKTQLTAIPSRAAERGRAYSRWALVGLLAVWVLAGSRAWSQTALSAKTLGGGPVTLGGPAAGYADGPGVQASQFNFPSGVAVDATGNLLVADRDNGRVRFLEIAADRVSTLVSGLSRPVGVLLDRDENVLVLLQGTGTVERYNRSGSWLGTVSSGFSEPTAFALDGSTNLYVAQRDGRIRRVSPTGVVSDLVRGLNEPSGLALTQDGRLAVTETGNHAVRLVELSGANAITLLAGGAGPGFVDGTGAAAKFSAPAGVALAPNGMLVVADRMNHRLRLVATNGVVSTLIGTDAARWSPDFPGWEDGDPTVAALREPYGVVVSREGIVYDLEVYYHLVREIRVRGLTSSTTQGGGTGGSTTNVVVTAPSFSPNTGYYPMGQTITVVSANPNVFYTVDSTEPTTNSFRVPMTNNVGAIFWNQPFRDVSSLRIRAFVGSVASPVVAGQQVSENTIGLSQDLLGGPGATVVVPVVVNLISNQPMRSLQFRVEVTALSGTTVISDQFRALSILTNDFVPIVSAAQSGAAALFSAVPYLNTGPSPNARGLRISFIGTNANMLVRGFGVAALLAVPIPAEAALGTRYRVDILNASATTDGRETLLPLSAATTRMITVAEKRYLVGDSSPGGWYNAGDFGDGELDNSDVNNAFYSALGIRAPFPFTDAFDAMDVFPPDNAFSVGGDGELRFLDWQTILLRSLRLDSTNWSRSWTAGGNRVAVTSRLKGSASTPAVVRRNSVRAGDVWVRQAKVSAGSLGNAGVESLVRVPVSVRVASGSSIAGLLMTAEIVPSGDSPTLDQPARFIPADGMPNGNTATPRNDLVGYGWDLGAFTPALTGSAILGYLEFKVPKGARSGECYVVNLMRADGAPDIQTQYDLETTPGCVWVNVPAATDASPVSDQWKVRFFGSGTAAEAASDADPDGDGQSNLDEYLAGTDPTLAASRLALDASVTAAPGGGVRLRWLSATGKLYGVESTTRLDGSGWTVVADGIPGNGEEQEWTDAGGAGASRFYRLKVNP